MEKPLSHLSSTPKNEVYSKDVLPLRVENFHTHLDYMDAVNSIKGVNIKFCVIFFIFEMENKEASFEHSGFCRSIQQDHTCFIKDIYEKLNNIEDGFFETESEFQAFFDFVEYGSVKFEDNLIYRVITLLKKLDLHVFAIQTLQSRLSQRKKCFS